MTVTAGPGVLRGDYQVTGRLVPNQFTPPAGCIENVSIAALAAIDASKLVHQYQPTYEQGSNTTAAADPGKVRHVVHGATGLLTAVKAGCVVANIGDSVVTVDVEKNGVSVLTSAISLSSSQTAFETVSGTLSGGSVALAVGDVLEFVVTVSGMDGHAPDLGPQQPAKFLPQPADSHLDGILAPAQSGGDFRISPGAVLARKEHFQLLEHHRLVLPAVLFPKLIQGEVEQGEHRRGWARDRRRPPHSRGRCDDAVDGA